MALLSGADPEIMKQYGDLPTVFYDDEQNNILIAAVPAEDRFGYFGYLKKMALTLHNIVMIKRGKMPFHGAMFKIGLKNGKKANIVIIGDTATGKSESIEAFRILAKDYIKELAQTIKIKSTGEIDENILFEKYLKKWLSSVVANVFDDDFCRNHTCLVLTGIQGTYKTTWLENLCPKELKSTYLYSGKIDPNSKDVNSQLCV